MGCLFHSDSLSDVKSAFNLVVTNILRFSEDLFKSKKMKELIFEVTEDFEGGYIASALGVGIHTQAGSVDELKEMVREAVECYFDGEEGKPALIRLHFVRDEVLAV